MNPELAADLHSRAMAAVDQTMYLACTQGADTRGFAIGRNARGRLPVPALRCDGLKALTILHLRLLILLLFLLVHANLSLFLVLTELDSVFVFLDKQPMTAQEDHHPQATPLPDNESKIEGDGKWHR